MKEIVWDSIQEKSSIETSFWKKTTYFDKDENQEFVRYETKTWEICNQEWISISQLIDDLKDLTWSNSIQEMSILNTLINLDNSWEYFIQENNWNKINWVAWIKNYIAWVKNEFDTVFWAKVAPSWSESQNVWNLTFVMKAQDNFSPLVDRLKTSFDTQKLQQAFPTYFDMLNSHVSEDWNFDFSQIQLLDISQTMTPDLDSADKDILKSIIKSPAAPTIIAQLFPTAHAQNL